MLEQQDGYYLHITQRQTGCEVEEVRAAAEQDSASCQPISHATSTGAASALAVGTGAAYASAPSSFWLLLLPRIDRVSVGPLHGTRLSFSDADAEYRFLSVPSHLSALQQQWSILHALSEGEGMRGPFPPSVRQQAR